MKGYLAKGIINVIEKKFVASQAVPIQNQLLHFVATWLASHRLGFVTSLRSNSNYLFF